MKKESNTTAVIDRFEGESAVLLVGEDERQVLFPVRELPEGLNEGDYLRMNIMYDVDATRNAQEEAQRLLDALGRRR